MNYNILLDWAKFHKLSNVEKRKLFRDLMREKIGISCEARIFQILTRLSFRHQKAKKFRYHADDKAVEQVVDELGISPRTAHNWFYVTAETSPLDIVREECAKCRLNGVCEYSVKKDVWEKIQMKYDYLLMSKRLRQIVIKKEIFCDLVYKRAGLISDDQLRTLLRGLVDVDYYRDRKLSFEHEAIKEALREYGIKAVTVIRWLYILKNVKVRIAQAQSNAIPPDEVIDAGALQYKSDTCGFVEVRI